MFSSETYTINNLKPDTSYVFLVRAENNHGMSPPSQMSERVRTLRLLASSNTNEFSPDSDNIRDTDKGKNLQDVQNTLLNKVVELRSIEAISSTAIRVTWVIRPEAIGAVEGFYVRYVYSYSK